MPVCAYERGINADVNIGVQKPLERSIGDILFGAEIIIDIIGIIMLYFTIGRDNPKPFSATPR
jgi:hypothetical protein